MPRNIVAFVSDLVFKSKIQEIFSDGVRFVRTLEKLPNELNQVIDLLIIDLSATQALNAIALARQHNSTLYIIAFGSHVEKELLAKAQQLGATEVVFRSTIVTRLQQLI